jgi:hypothetical protein
MHGRRSDAATTEIVREFMKNKRLTHQEENDAGSKSFAAQPL